ncbi:sugar ABC transporter ATP-binding protein [Agrobacterium rhizogenes]|uniref:ATP-binding cassette domain-containing protein n=1 Tax=Rhizobium rhizogenes TaxID=359 RepID=UPI0015748617|nr:ATP-binding cassette domain-containing protein [Rhizobium rhizogenes]NTF91656.1 sugar ABC transporter ATP-binding protein [Rhizobium rhizogenes]
MEGSSSPALQVRNISMNFGGVAALSDVSLNIEAGQVLALCGDNGAGKSTLVKIVSGIQSPSEGEIRVDGRPVAMTSPHEANLAGIQTVYQDLALCDNLDTVQNLFLGRELRSPWYQGRRLNRPAMEARAKAVLASLDVRIRDTRAPSSFLSGGQRQSVAICRSILSDPQVILLDEPTAALGVAQRKQVLSLIERLKGQGRAVMLISHDLGDVLQVADRVAVLRLGRKVSEFTRGAYSREDLVSSITGINA